MIFLDQGNLCPHLNRQQHILKSNKESRKALQANYKENNEMDDEYKGHFGLQRKKILILKEKYKNLNKGSNDKRCGDL